MWLYKKTTEELSSAPVGTNTSAANEWGVLPAGAKNSQRNLGLMVARGDLTLFSNSTAKFKKNARGRKRGREGGKAGGKVGGKEMMKDRYC